MADVAKPAAKKATKPKKAPSHPKYAEMVNAAIKALKQRGGCSKAAILKYIMANYKVGDNTTMVNSHLKLALKAGVKAGTFKQTKGTGASGSFKIGQEVKPAKPKKAKKPKAAKPAKKPAAKKSAAAKKAKTPKKAAAKKPAAKKAAAKPKKAKTPKKAAAKKPAAKKPAAKKPAAKPKKAKTPKKTPKKAAK